ncbi:MAG TPA: two-component regulator propeller domain-containing protein [Xanthomonadales bacterium]|nr:two-component regulator propeller domain-containing protein [Xanthomonadales bacterium]
MRIGVRLACVSLALSGSLAAPMAGAAAMRFDAFASEQGLSENTVRAIAQDRQGFLWVGTEDGLNRFDGISFRTYRSGPGSSHELAEDFVNALLVTHDDALWIGTFGGGLSRYDPRTGAFENHLHDPGDPRSLSHDDVSALYEDANRRLWVGTRGGGVDRIDLATGAIERVAGDATLREATQQVSALAGDGEGGVWVGTPARGLVRIDASLALHAGDVAEAAGTDRLDEDITALLRDAAGALWVGTRAHGLARRAADGQWTRWRHRHDAQRSLGDDEINGLYQDRAGTIWIATGMGLDRYDAAHDRFEHHRRDPLDRTSLPHNFAIVAFEDSVGSLWVGTGGGGIARHRLSSGMFEVFQHDGASAAGGAGGIWSMLEDERGTVWIGTLNGGLHRLSRTSGRIAPFPVALADRDVRALLAPTDGTLWVGSRHGLDVLDRDRRPLRRFVQDPFAPGSLRNDYVRAMLQDARGRIWIGTYGGGLHRWEPEREAFSAWHNDPARADSLSDDRVYCLLEDGDDALWVGTHGGGLDRFDIASGTFARYRHDPAVAGSLPSDRVLALRRDLEGDLWVGSGSGLARFAAATQRFEGIAQLEGSTVYSILVDARDRLWLSTNDGLVRFDPKTRQVRRYPGEGALTRAEFNGGAASAGRSGRLYFGGMNALVAVDPRVEEAVESEPRVVLTDLLLFNRVVRTVAHDADSPLAQTLEYTPRIELRHDHSVFGFGFAALDTADPMLHGFSYRLEGFSDRWLDAPPTQRTAVFTNVPSGSYRFRVRTTDVDGRWLAKEAGIDVRVLPAPWRSPLAYAAYALAIAALLGWFAWQRARRMAQKRRAQERLRESEDRLSMALWGSGDELFDWRAPTGTLVRMSGARGENAIVVPGVYHVDDIARYVHRDDFPAYREAFLRCLAGETESYEAQYRIALEPGKFSWRLVRGRVVERNPDGSPARVAGSQRDISALKAAEAQLMQLTETLETRVRERTEELDQRRHELEGANARLEESIAELHLAQEELIESEKMASLGRLVAGIAHEVNTPLGVGVTAVSFLKQQLVALRGTLATAPNVAASVQLVEQASQLIETNLTRAAQLVSTFKQVAVDQSASTIRKVEVRAYLDGILESLHPQLRRQPHRIEIDCDPATTTCNAMGRSSIATAP